MSQYATFRFLVGITAVLGLLSTLGCGAGGSDTGSTGYPVTGKVIYDGKGLDKAIVTFIPSDNAKPSARAVTKDDGSFETKVVDGVFSVTVKKSNKAGPEVSDPEIGMKLKPDMTIPIKFSLPTKTPFQDVVISATETNSLTLDLDNGKLSK